ncbi:MAG: RHS repeat-associated core domain-containing protein [Spirochaetia bacterium]
MLPFGNSAGQHGILDEDGLFTGKELDADTGLYYFNARWYHPGTGRFITEDPARDGLNWFVYCSQNPLIYVDPTGLQTSPIAYMDSESQRNFGQTMTKVVQAAFRNVLSGLLQFGTAPDSQVSMYDPNAVSNWMERDAQTRQSIDDFTGLKYDSPEEAFGVELSAIAIEAGVDMALGYVTAGLVSELGAVDDVARNTKFLNTAQDGPSFQVSRSRTPNIAQNIENAQSSGQPINLTRMQNRSGIRANRRAALRGHQRPDPSMSLDEYPFASTYEGGSGATVSPVPATEQNIQGGELGGIYRSNNIVDREQFTIEVID